MDRSGAGAVINQKYRLERKLGQGGMGEVWVARHLPLDTDVALKLLVSGHAGTPGARARFEREAKAAAQVKSPHIVHVFDYGVDGETPYLAMELLEGEDLETRLRREGRLSLEQTAALLVPVCKALRRIHDAGLVHRDLKPSNVFLARHDDEDHVKILDFGIAKTTSVARAGDTTGGVVVGSPPYMSPEQVLARKELDHRTDLWSLGVIVFRALTGRLPFWSDVVTQLLMEICMAPAPRASQLAPDLGRDVDAFFERALAKEAAARFQTAAELAEALGALRRVEGGARSTSQSTQPVFEDAAATMQLPAEAGPETGDATLPVAPDPAMTRTIPDSSPPPPEVEVSRSGAQEPAVALHGAGREWKQDLLGEHPRPLADARGSEAGLPASRPQADPGGPETPPDVRGAEAARADVVVEGQADERPPDSAPPHAAATDRPSPPRRGTSLLPAVAIGALLAALLVGAATALSPDLDQAISGQPSRPEVASGPAAATSGPGVTTGASPSGAARLETPPPPAASVSPTLAHPAVSAPAAATGHAAASSAAASSPPAPARTSAVAPEPASSPPVAPGPPEPAAPGPPEPAAAPAPPQPSSTTREFW